MKLAGRQGGGTYGHWEPGATSSRYQDGGQGSALRNVCTGSRSRNRGTAAVTAPAEAIRPADILALQRSVGNRAIQGLLARRAGQRGARCKRRSRGRRRRCRSRRLVYGSISARPCSAPLRALARRGSGRGPHSHWKRIRPGRQRRRREGLHCRPGYPLRRRLLCACRSEGIHLLAHEVAHTVQNRGGAPALSTKLEVSNPADPAEIEAERAADAMVAGSSPDLGRAPSAIHRDDEKPADKPADAPRPQARPRRRQLPPATRCRPSGRSIGSRSRRALWSRISRMRGLERTPRTEP